MQPTPRKLSRREALAATVAIGKGGMLYHRFQRTFDQVAGAVPLAGRQLARWVAMLESRHAWCAARGIPYVMLVVPEKHVVYADMLPDGATVSHDRPVNQIAEALSPKTRKTFVYPAQPLIDGRQLEDTWLKTDVHWTGWGAYIGYRTLMEAVGQHIPIEPMPADRLVRTPRNLIGDLGVRLDPEVSEDALSYGCKGAQIAQRVFGSFNYSAGQVEIFENGRPGTPSCVLFRDSNATTLLPYLAPHFSRLVTVASAEMFHEVVQSEKPDLVIVQTTERQLARPVTDDEPDHMLFPNDFCQAGFEDLSGVSLPLPPTRNSQLISFHSEGNAELYMGEGWSWQEGTHVWMQDEVSTLVGLPVPVAGLDIELILTGYPLTDTITAKQRLQLEIDGTVITEIEVDRFGENRFVIPAAMSAHSATINIGFTHPDAFAPSDRGESSETRRLAFSVAHVLLRAIG